MNRSNRNSFRTCLVALAATAVISCDKGEKAEPEVVEVPVPVLSGEANAAQEPLSEPKRYVGETAHQGAAKVTQPELPVTYEARDGSAVVTKLSTGAVVTRLVDMGSHSLIEYSDGNAKKLGWVPSAGLTDEQKPTAIPTQVAAGQPAAVAAAATTTATAATGGAAATAAAATTATPAAATTDTPAAATTDTPAAATATAPKARRGRLGR